MFFQKIENLTIAILGILIAIFDSNLTPLLRIPYGDDAAHVPSWRHRGLYDINASPGLPRGNLLNAVTRRMSPTAHKRSIAHASLDGLERCAALTLRKINTCLDNTLH